MAVRLFALLALGSCVERTRSAFEHRPIIGPSASRAAVQPAAVGCREGGGHPRSAGLVRLRGGQGDAGTAAAQIQAVLGRRLAVLGPGGGHPTASGTGDAGRGSLRQDEAGAGLDNASQASTVGGDIVPLSSQSMEQHIRSIFGPSEDEQRAEQLARARAALMKMDGMRPSMQSEQAPLSSELQGEQTDADGDDDDSCELPRNTPLVRAAATTREEDAILQRYEALKEGLTDEMEYYRAKKAEFDKKLSARPIHNDILGCSERANWDAKNALRWENEVDSRPDPCYLLRDSQGRRVTPSGKLLPEEEWSLASSRPTPPGPSKFINVPSWAKMRDNLPSPEIRGASRTLRKGRGQAVGSSSVNALSVEGGKNVAAGAAGRQDDGSCLVDRPCAGRSWRARRQGADKEQPARAAEHGPKRDGVLTRKHKVRLALMHMQNERFPFLTKKNFKRMHRARG